MIYSSLASSYDALFPASPEAEDFLASLAPARGRPRVLDAGCATGAHALALAARGWEALGLDSEAAMIDAARAAARRAGLAAEFRVADILGVASLLEGRSFDLVLCLGNTLPHLLGDGASSFLAQARGLLGPGGALVLQCLNFALPGVGPGYAFPELSAGGAVMRRRYEAPPREKAGLLRFVVSLEKNGRAETGETLLEPIPPSRLAALLGEAGFAPPTLSSGWAGRPFDEGSDPYLIAVARPAGLGGREPGDRAGASSA